MTARSLSRAIADTLATGEWRAKVFATRQLLRDWRSGRFEFVFDTPMPARPAWPASVQCLSPGQMPRRGKMGSGKNRIALWHALAHIEFVAIDLALDMAGRFGETMRKDFVADFLSVAADEAMHFALLARKLDSLGSFYGALPVHDGLWSAAENTAHDVAARLAVVPMVLEARGLDVTPATRDRVAAQGDENGAKILERILDDEIRHVGIGSKHFHALCAAQGAKPRETWQNLVDTYFHGAIRPPFNDSARFAGGLPREYYAGVA